MAPIVNTTTTVATASAGITASVDIAKPRDIPKPRGTGFWTGRDTFAAVTARAPPSKNQPTDLPTPPNSISPSIPPQFFGSRAPDAPPTPPAPMPDDSDLDLQDAVDDANVQDRPHHGSTGGRGLQSLHDLGAAGEITPAMLAKHHLPGILLENGPLHIRHIMDHLTTSVPGFAHIRLARARRLVVSALESRFGGVEQGSEDSHVVIFEKVGWGQWDASRRRRSSRDAQPIQLRQGSQAAHRSPMNHPSGSNTAGATRQPIPSQESSSDTIMFPEPESMSIDERESHLPSLEDEIMMSGETTSEEDWEGIGAAALRGEVPQDPINPRGAVPFPHAQRRDRIERRRRRGLAHITPRPSRNVPRASSNGPKSTLTVPKSASRSNSPNVYNYPQHRSSTPPDRVDFSKSPLPDGGLETNSAQELEAIEALVKLKNV